MARYYTVRGSYLQRLKTMIGNRIISNRQKILPEREGKNSYPLSFLPYNPMQCNAFYNYEIRRKVVVPDKMNDNCPSKGRTVIS
jgi:hypothetical protein